MLIDTFDVSFAQSHFLDILPRGVGSIYTHGLERVDRYVHFLHTTINRLLIRFYLTEVGVILLEVFESHVAHDMGETAYYLAFLLCTRRYTDLGDKQTRKPICVSFQVPI